MCGAGGESTRRVVNGGEEVSGEWQRGSEWARWSNGEGQLYRVKRLARCWLNGGSM